MSEPLQTPVADEIWGGEVLHEEWRIVDKWWTDNPFHRSYRDITRMGRRRVEYADEGTNWQWVEYPNLGESS